VARAVGRAVRSLGAGFGRLACSQPREHWSGTSRGASPLEAAVATRNKRDVPQERATRLLPPLALAWPGADARLPNAAAAPRVQAVREQGSRWQRTTNCKSSNTSRSKRWPPSQSAGANRPRLDPARRDRGPQDRPRVAHPPRPLRAGDGSSPRKRPTGRNRRNLGPEPRVLIARFTAGPDGQVDGSSPASFGRRKSVAAASRSGVTAWSIGDHLAMGVRFGLRDRHCAACGSARGAIGQLLDGRTDASDLVSSLRGAASECVDGRRGCGDVRRRGARWRCGTRARRPAELLPGWCARDG
jgi:hypothetical protein